LKGLNHPMEEKCNMRGREGPSGRKGKPEANQGAVEKWGVLPGKRGWGGKEAIFEWKGGGDGVEETTEKKEMNWERPLRRKGRSFEIGSKQGKGSSIRLRGPKKNENKGGKCRRNQEEAEGRDLAPSTSVAIWGKNVAEGEKLRKKKKVVDRQLEKKTWSGGSRQEVRESPGECR